MMAPIVGLVLILCACMSVSGDIENCPNAKYPFKEFLDENVYIKCTFDVGGHDCSLNYDEKEKTLDAEFYFIAEEDISDVYYNVSLVGNNITAGSSGKAKAYAIENYSRVVKTVPKNTVAYVDFKSKLEGNMPKGEGNATVQLYFNEPMKYIPDICVTVKLIIYSPSFFG